MIIKIKMLLIFLCFNLYSYNLTKDKELNKFLFNPPDSTSRKYIEYNDIDIYNMYWNNGNQIEFKIYHLEQHWYYNICFNGCCDRCDIDKTNIIGEYQLNTLQRIERLVFKYCYDW